jgi:cytoskeletal protein RodZ
MEQLGARLKAARETRGRSLREIAATTKISIAALEAVERNDYSKLPGGIFGRAFMRAYAQEVGLDPEATAREFMGEVEQHERNAAKKVRPPDVTLEDKAFLERQRQAARILRLVVIALLVAGIAFAVWRLRPLWLGTPPQSTPTATPPKADYRPPPSATLAQTPTAGTNATPSASGAAPTASPVAAPSGNRLTIEFDVSADCWVQVSADGLVVLERVMKVGEHQKFAADHEIGLDVGNAGAFNWTINGKPAKALGKAGTHKQARVTLATVADFLQ